MSNQTLTVFTDGGSRGNPGPAAIGFLVKDDKGNILAKVGKAIGRATNNVAEYTAVIEALKWLQNNCEFTQPAKTQINFFLDSKLVVNQLNGLYKIKDAGLRNLAFEVRRQEAVLGQNIYYRHIGREKNTIADFLVNSCFKKKPSELFHRFSK